MNLLLWKSVRLRSLRFPYPTNLCSENRVDNVTGELVVAPSGASADVQLSSSDDDDLPVKIIDIDIAAAPDVVLGAGEAGDNRFGSLLTAFLVMCSWERPTTSNRGNCYLGRDWQGASFAAQVC